MDEQWTNNEQWTNYKLKNAKQPMNKRWTKKNNVRTSNEQMMNDQTSNEWWMNEQTMNERSMNDQLTNKRWKRWMNYERMADDEQMMNDQTMNKRWASNEQTTIGSDKG